MNNNNSSSHSNSSTNSNTHLKSNTQVDLEKSKLTISPSTNSATYNAVNGTIKGAKEVAGKIKEHLNKGKSLKSFELVDNDEDLGDAGAVPILEALMENPNLSELKLKDNYLGEKSAKIVANLLKNNPNLTYIDLSDNNLTGKDVTLIMKALKKHKSLKFLDVSENDFEEFDCDDSDSDSDSDCDCDDVDDSNEYWANTIAETVASNYGLQCLKIGENNENGLFNFIPIAAALESNTSLVEFDLSDNKLKEDFALKISNSLANNKSLERLDLSFNKFGDHGAIHIANMLIKNSTLKEINLKENKIGNTGLSALCEAIEKNPDSGITTLNVSGNNYDKEGYTSVLKLLAVNITIVEFEYDKINKYSNTKIDENIEIEINKYLKRNRDFALPQKVRKFIKSLPDWKQNADANAKAIQQELTTINAPLAKPDSTGCEAINELESFKYLCLAQKYFTQYQKNVLPSNINKKLQRIILCLNEVIKLDYHKKLGLNLAAEVVAKINVDNHLADLKTVMDELKLSSDHYLREIILAKDQPRNDQHQKNHHRKH